LLSALACEGLGETEKALGLLQQVIADDPNHLFAVEMLQWLRREDKSVPQEIEVRPVS
jgi:hypothetical protein